MRFSLANVLSPRAAPLAAGLALALTGTLGVAAATAATTPAEMTTITGTAATAAAAPTTITGTDAAGDAGARTGLDLTSGSVKYDSAAGSVKATITTTATNAKLTAGLVVGLGHLAVGNTCDTDAKPSFTMVVRLDADTLAWGVGADDAGIGGFGTAPWTRSGTQLSLATGANKDALKKRGWNCFMVTTKTIAGDLEGTDVDAMAGLTATGGAADDATAPLAPPVVTDQPDADRDGIADVADHCPAVAGARADGCLTIAAKLGLRLGAKRVAADLLLPLKGTSCPATVKVAVTAKGKRLGAGKLRVGQHGAYCWVFGAVKLKHRAKKARVVITAAGITKYAKSVTRK